jgi:hypothetical protein
MLAALALVLAGCGSDRGVLARVGGERITLERFNEAARSGPYPGEPDSAKKRLLDDLVQRERWSCARRDGMNETIEYRKFREQTEQQLLRETPSSACSAARSRSARRRSRSRGEARDIHARAADPDLRRTARARSAGGGRVRHAVRRRG